MDILSVPNLPQICTASAYVYSKSIINQMQYRFALNFGTLCRAQCGHNGILYGTDSGEYFVHQTHPAIRFYQLEFES